VGANFVTFAGNDTRSSSVIEGIQTIPVPAPLTRLHRVQG